jgi:hypothetical protein
MVRRLIISLIVFLMAGTCMAQGNFGFNQHGGGSCQYGVLSEYSEKWIYGNVPTDICSDWSEGGTLANLKIVIDQIRGGCVESAHGMTIGFFRNFNVNSYILRPDSESRITCSLLSYLSNGYHVVVAPYSGIDEAATVDIINVTNGVITYHEVY